MNLEEQDIRNKKLQKVVKKIVKSAHKMDPNLKRLEKVVKKLHKVSFYLLENSKQEQQEQHELELQLFKDRETRCLPKSVLIGRGEEKDFVMQWLRNEDPASPTFNGNISLLSIVGVGGVGKTTLLQHIYKDLKEEFELKMWVCVSNDFDANMVIADMLECLMKERPLLEALAALQNSLKDAVQSKRFLFVLDDIWEEDDRKWENVLSPLIHGSIGSKILLTTRMDSVAAMISNVIGKKKETLKLNGLEEDVCLKLLNTRAFTGEENLENQTKLADIASLIVKKLSGSPLVAKAIGDVLNSNLKESFWKNILNSNVLNAESELGRNNILGHLRLSFTFLPQPLQNCFAFCGIFPQDYEFDKDDLVRMWIALGFIQKSFFEEENLEAVGGRYFDDLVKKSFFDKFQYGNRIHYKTHALLHDLALSISSEECFRFVEDNIQSLRIPKTIRHLFVKTENLEVLRMIKGVKNLHSLLLISRGGGQGFTKILTEIFNASQSIRLLFINSPDLETLSESIKNLRHLRYLNLNVNLTRMPRSLSSLYHLQFIIYKKVVQGSCCNDFLSDEVSNLSKLRHLEFPSSVIGIGKLKSFRELNEFNVKNENGYRIEELKHMSELRKLRIHYLENVNDASEARTANLYEKKNLTDLFLNWGNTVDEGNLDEEFGCLRRIVNSDLDEKVLENLKPYKNLKSLSIFSYKGAKFAEWMCYAGRISNLEHISLNGCSEWETLPPFGELRYLKRLYLCNMPKAKRLYYKSRGNVFPSLEVLNIKGLQVLEDWFDGAAAYDRFFRCLTELSLDNCPNLQELPYLPPKLKKMRICMIGWKSLNCKQGTSKSIPLETLEVRLCSNISHLFFLVDVAKLTIEGCPNLTSLGGVQQVESGTEKFQLIVSEVDN